MKKTRMLVALLIVVVLAFSFVLTACSPALSGDALDKARNNAREKLKVNYEALIEGTEYGTADRTILDRLYSDAWIKIGELTSQQEIDDCVTNAIKSFLTDVKGNAQYTYRMGPSDLPTAWNLHTYQSDSSTYVLDYASDSLYAFDYNDDFTGYEIVPSMASDFPTDVTAEKNEDGSYKYLGRFGITQEDIDAGNKVYSIPLKTNLKFDNGESLTAQDFVESMKLLLAPEAANYRADNVYSSGDLKIVGAESYVKQGSTSIEDATGGEGVGFGDHVWGNVVRDEEKNVTSWECTLSADVQSQLIFDLNNTYVAKWALDNYGANGYTAAEVFANYAFGSTKEAAKVEALDGKTLAEILADDTLKAYLGAILYDFWCTDAGEEFGFFGIESEWPEFSFADVGFFAPDDETLVIVLKNAMEDNFYLRYELCTHFFLVYPELYSRCISTTGGVYSNSYGTSVDTFVGYGPYKLTTYVADSTIILEKNPYWHGYSANEYKEGTYQTTRIEYIKVTENSTRLEMFLKGELDSYGLQAEDIQAGYGSSDYTYYTDSESTWYLVMNPQKANLENKQKTATPVNAGYTVNKTVLTIDAFRQALSYSIDRTAFNLALNPTSGVASSLLSSMIIADPETGLNYRSYDEAKDAILSFWGLSDAWGEGKEYATREEAIASITGYDPEGAKKLFDQAYDEAVEKELLTEEQIASGKWEVQIVVGQPSAGNYYTKSYEWLKSNWTDAVKGTKFEGHVTFVLSQVLGSTAFGQYLRDGSVDILHSVGYGGSMFNPYTMMKCFVDNLQYDPFTNKQNVMIDVELEIDGAKKVLRASVYNWVAEALQGNEIEAVVVGKDGTATEEKVTLSAGSSDKFETRLAILAKAEETILNIGNVFPLMTDSTAAMRSKRINYKTEEYVLGMGRGGVQYYTYAMNDAEWAVYVSEQGGTLSYK